MHQHLRIRNSITSLHTPALYLIVKKYAMALICSVFCFTPLDHFRATILLQSFSIPLYKVDVYQLADKTIRTMILTKI